MEKRLAQQFQDNSSTSDNKKTVYINTIKDNKRVTWLTVGDS